MSKSNYYFGQSTLGQVLKLIPTSVVSKAVKHSKSDFAVKKFSTLNHLYTMCYAVLADVTGLRHVCDGLLAMGEKLKHLGLDYVVPKSTLSDSNKNRSSEVFGQIYQGIYHHFHSFISDSSTVEPLLRKAYAVDSTTMSLFKAILKASGRKSKDGNAKGGIKSHVQLRLLDELPMNVKYTAGAANDHDFLKHLLLEKGDIAIFDKAYVDYAQYAKWSSEGIYFVTREKDNAKSIVLLERDLPEDKDFEILLDEQVIKVYKDGENQTQKFVLRRIVIWSDKHQAQIVLLTNMFYLEVAQVSHLYRKRWRIELLFKQLKQNFPLKYFLGDNENAIQIQIWCCLIVNLLITIIKFKTANKKMSFALTVSIIRQHLMSYINILHYLKYPEGLRVEFKKSYPFRENYHTQTDLVFNTC
jgi:Transposase DDE domain/Domain of unknown function (DUF4372)